MYSSVRVLFYFNSALITMKGDEIKLETSRCLEEHYEGFELDKGNMIRTLLG